MYLQTKNPTLGTYILETVVMENVCLFYVHFVHFTFGIFYGSLVCFMAFGILEPFWYIVPRKIWQPWML
jgi:hypothetical protein